MVKVLVVAFIVVSLCSLSHGELSVVASFSDGEASGRSNIESDVVMRCLVTSSEPMGITFKLRWLKKQDGDFRIIGTHDDVEQILKQSTDKYKITITNPYDGDALKLLYEFRVNGVEAMEAGEYACDAGFNIDDLTRSNSVSLIVSPGQEATVDLMSDAPIEDGNSKFNDPQTVTCTGSTNSLSPDLDITMTVTSVDGSITNDFTRDTQVMWMGEENALKVPKTTISLKSDSWQLMGYEDSTLKCELFDGVRPLNSDTLPVARDEPPIIASLSCTDNFDRPVREGDLDLYVTCNVNDYDKVGDYKLKYVFNIDNETLTSDESNNHKWSIKQKDTEKGNVTYAYVLHIPRVTSDIVQFGRNDMHIKFVKVEGDMEETIATTDYDIKVSNAGQIRGAAVTSNLSSTLAFVTFLLYSLCGN